MTPFLFSILLLAVADLVWWESDIPFRLRRARHFEPGTEDHRLEVGLAVARYLRPLPEGFSAKVMTCRLCFRLWFGFGAVLLSLVVPEAVQQIVLIALGPWVLLNVLRPA